MNVFHAGDGNLHPLILFDANRPGDVAKTLAFGAKILELCIEVGGTITGEHGVGVEKLGDMCMQFAPAELERFLGVKRAFDPEGLLNPGKARADAASLRRDRQHARAPRPARASGPAALLGALPTNAIMAIDATARPDPGAVADLVRKLCGDYGERAITTRAVREHHGHGEGHGGRGAARRRRVSRTPTTRSRRSCGCVISPGCR